MSFRFLIPLFAASVMLAPASQASERDPFDDGPQIGIPVKFASTNGGTFRPDRLIIRIQGGTLLTQLPRTSDDVRSEDRIGLSDVPLIGGVFQGRLAVSDARKGDIIGDVRRVGDSLVVDASGWPQSLQGLPVTLSTRTPRRGEVSYRLGRLRYTQGVNAGGAGQIVGFAALVGGQLVIASNTYSAPGIADLFK